MSWEAWRVAIDLAQFIWLALMAIWVHLRTAHQATAGKLEELHEEVQQKMSSQAERISRLEVAVQHGPSAENIKILHERIDELSRAVNQLVGQFDVTKERIRLMSEHLLRGGGGN